MRSQSSSNSDADKTESVLCSTVGSGFSAISGGAVVDSSDDGVAIVESRPVGVVGGVPTGWEASATEMNDVTGNWTLTVYAVCAKVAG
ncbi:MAG: hypothetical protein OXC55_03295 [Chloroflexi bacterium]|nr:hypothetical protein [Chloroflexota bacterium]